METPEFISITAIDKHSSDTISRTFSTESAILLKAMVEDWEKKDVPFSRYELTTQDFIDEFPDDIVDVLEELEVEG